MVRYIKLNTAEKMGGGPKALSSVSSHHFDFLVNFSFVFKVVSLAVSLYTTILTYSLFLALSVIIQLWFYSTFLHTLLVHRLSKTHGNTHLLETFYVYSKMHVTYCGPLWIHQTLASWDYFFFKWNSTNCTMCRYKGILGFLPLFFFKENPRVC